MARGRGCADGSVPRAQARGQQSAVARIFGTNKLPPAAAPIAEELERAAVVIDRLTHGACPPVRLLIDENGESYCFYDSENRELWLDTVPLGPTRLIDAYALAVFGLAEHLDNLVGDGEQSASFAAACAEPNEQPLFAELWRKIQETTGQTDFELGLVQEALPLPPPPYVFAHAFSRWASQTLLAADPRDYDGHALMFMQLGPRWDEHPFAPVAAEFDRLFAAGGPVEQLLRAQAR